MPCCGEHCFDHEENAETGRRQVIVQGPEGTLSSDRLRSSSDSTMKGMTSAKARKRLTPRPQLENAPTAVLVTARGGGEFPPSYARHSSTVADARRTAVYTPFFLRAPTVAGAEINEAAARRLERRRHRYYALPSVSLSSSIVRAGR
jgi:hypothetical protein